jgi:hypothetical protein
MTRLNSMQESFTLTYRQAGGKQIPQSFEGGAKDTLTVKLLEGVTSSTEEIGLKALVLDENEESLEIKAK